MKNRYVLLADLPLIALAAWAAFTARFDWAFYENRPEFVLYLVGALAVKPVVFLLFGLYRRYWRYASISDLAVVFGAVSVSSIVMSLLVAVALAFVIDEFSRVVVLNDWLMTMATVGGLRIAIRVANESKISRSAVDRSRRLRRILVVGAGAAGTMVTREMKRNPQLGMEPVGFLDDDPEKIGKDVGGLRVLGASRALPGVVSSREVEEVIIAMPTASGSVVRAILELCNRAGVRSRTMPGMFELLDGQVSVGRLRNVDIADLLRRSQVRADGVAAAFISGQVVLITGAGGSIGFELARQVARAAPTHLVMLGHGENSIFDAEASIRAAFPDLAISVIIADIRDGQRLARVFDETMPDIVFHAAAHKHVPLMEENPEEAVSNNIIGTRNVVNHAMRAGTQRFVLISTDKAVSPTSIMGATKRVAEAIVRHAAQESGRAFVSVRFGNVLGSRGSVVNTFKKQIERGGPVTVTHPEMTRFFMTIPEAVHLVLQASGQGKGGELFVLNMGEPVRIVDLARDLIRLSGFSEGDIPVVFTGVRPGEKMAERLFGRGMTTRPTAHPDVLEVVGTELSPAVHLDEIVRRLANAAGCGDRAEIQLLLGQLVPGFVFATSPGDSSPRTPVSRRGS